MTEAGSGPGASSPLPHRAFLFAGCQILQVPASSDRRFAPSACNLVRAKQHADGCRIQIAAIFPKGERITPVHEQLCISDDPDLIDHGCFAGLPAKKRGIRLLFEKTDRRRIFLLRLRPGRSAPPPLPSQLCHSGKPPHTRRAPVHGALLRTAARYSKSAAHSFIYFQYRPTPFFLLYPSTSLTPRLFSHIYDSSRMRLPSSTALSADTITSS